ncbi:hypothetical protein HPB51_024263 [Rhipicephalus microplus]|uniref:Uncharacterized protein n=1 Tax=Rhipicephalus microplus TaxID=6941 RepID=A0A9J6EK74_RHIMP|nr:hypothetical protein HPB51_024263 [Rhipicephalus microplus]
MPARPLPTVATSWLTPPAFRFSFLRTVASLVLRSRPPIIYDEAHVLPEPRFSFDCGAASFPSLNAPLVRESHPLLQLRRFLPFLPARAAPAKCAFLRLDSRRAPVPPKSSLLTSPLPVVAGENCRTLRGGAFRRASEEPRSVLSQVDRAASSPVRRGALGFADHAGVLPQASGGARPPSSTLSNFRRLLGVQLAQEERPAALSDTLAGEIYGPPHLTVVLVAFPRVLYKRSAVELLTGGVSSSRLGAVLAGDERGRHPVLTW